MLFKKILFSTFAMLALTSYAMAEQSLKTNDGYVIHYNAVNNDFLNPETAKAYQITRSKNRAFLMVSVKTDDNKRQAAHAKVIAQAVNLSGQLKTLKMREIVEGSADSKAIYYIGDFRFSNQETLIFTVRVDSAYRGSEYTFEFVQQFFVKLNTK
jgi:hypothetical protein